MRALAPFVAAAALSFSSTAAASNDTDAEAIARARAELSRRIEAAGAGGAIAVRGALQLEPTAAPAPQLRDPALANCLTTTALAQTAEKLSANKAKALDQLRANLLSEGGADRTGAELALARAYLVLGFAEEAHAIASARSGAEPAAIAGLASLAGGDREINLAAVSEHRACGALYDFIADAAGVLRGAGEELSGASLGTLSRLPQPLRQPLAEALAVNALGADETLAKEFLEIGGGPAGTSASSLVNAVTDRSEAGSATLAALGSSPGPHRAEALNALSARLDQTASAEITAAFESDAAEAVEAAPISASISALNIALADRRIARGDVGGAARALGDGARHKQTRAAAIAKFAAMTKPLLRSKNPSERLSALEAISLEPALAAESLPIEDARLAAASLADLGAEASLANFMSSASFNSLDDAYFKSRALAQAGRFAEARALAAAHAKDPRVAQLLLQTAYSEADAAELKENAALAVEPSVASGAYWRTGNFPALMALASLNPAEAATLKRIALAFLTARKAPPKPFLAADKTGAISALFMASPKAGAADPREIERLAQYRQSEIVFLRAAVRDE
jgi:hypothetical protein